MTVFSGQRDAPEVSFDLTDTHTDPTTVTLAAHARRGLTMVTINLKVSMHRDIIANSNITKSYANNNIAKSYVVNIDVNTHLNAIHVYIVITILNDVFPHEKIQIGY